MNAIENNQIAEASRFYAERIQARVSELGLSSAKELSVAELDEIAGGVEWPAVAAGVGLVALGVGLTVATGGLGTLGLGVILGAGTLGEIGIAATAVGLAGSGGFAIGSGLTN